MRLTYVGMDSTVVVYTRDHGRKEFTYEEWFNYAARYQANTYHRVDGPAIEWSSGNKFWYLEDKKISEEEFNQLIQEVKDMPLALRLVDPRRWVREYVD